MDFTTITTSNNNNNTDDTNNSQLLHEQQQQQQQQIISTSLAAVSSPLIHTQQSQYQQQQAIRIETTNINNNNNNNLSRTATPTVNNNNNESSLSISSSSIPRNPLSNKSKNKNDLNNNNNSNNNITTTQHHSSDSTLPIIDPILQPIINIKERLLSLRGCSLSKMNVNTILSENDIKLLCTTVRPILLDNNTNNILLELEAPIKVCGDIHGQYIDLLRIFDYGGFPPESNYLFLGDYVDRGKYSIEVICLLLCYKILYNNKFYILRGNHESSGINRIYGFYDECKRKYNIKIWKIFCDIFNCLPVSAIIDEKILCMHGGLSPELYNIEQILYIERPCDIPDIGLLCDLLWSDPSNNINGWESNDRGVSYIFGKDIVYNFCNDNNIDLIIRAHQVVEDGYEFFASKKLITIFSAPNYCGEFNNAGCILNIDENLLCTFQIIKPNLNKYNNNNNSNTKRKSNNNNSNNNNNNTDNNSNSNKSLLDNNDNDFDDLPNTNQIHTFLNANNNINNDIDNKNNNNEVTYNAHNNNHNDKYSNNS